MGQRALVAVLLLWSGIGIGCGDEGVEPQVASLGGASGVSGASGAGAGGASGSSGGASGASGSSGTGGAGVWRAFADDSPWNTPIEQNPELDPESDAMIADLAGSSRFGSLLGINIERFSVPRYDADASTRRLLVRCRLGGFGFPGNDGLMASAMVPWPEGALPDPGTDHHLLIIDRSTNTEWAMGRVTGSGDTWTCGLGATLDLSGPGYRPPAQGNPTWYTSHGPRACGFGLTAGLILREQIDSGSIEHALAMAYPHVRAGLYRNPASTAQARIGNQSIKTRGIPCGGRVQLDPSIDVDALGLDPGPRAVMIALQKYGAYVGDFSESINLYAENSPEAQAHWANGVLTTRDLASLNVNDLRVLALGELFDNGNGD